MVNSSIAPNYQIIVNGKDVTASIKPCLISLSITDNHKDEADTLELMLSKKFKRPNYGDEIKVYLGWGSNIRFAGLFFFQKSTLINNKQLTIQATGIDFTKGLKERRNKDYDVSLNEVVKIIAERHGLTVKTNMNVGTRFDQKNESDMAFLNRMAKEYNAVFNIKNNTLYMMQKGADVPQVSLDINKCVSSEITHTNTTFYKSCKAIFHDTKLNKVVEAVVGEGVPILIKQGKWLNKQQALEAAKNALQRANQGTAEGTVTIIGHVIFAGSELLLDNERYQIEKVTHNLSNGWLTDIQFKQDGSTPV
ncbi:MAG: hypothetical protein JKY87_04525 [Mariprofundus sp.]|nr:hypothetical protein [Mariprofundus sp.]